MIPYIKTEQGVSFFAGGRSHAISRESKIYEEVVDAIRMGAGESAILDMIEREEARLNKATQITDAISVKAGQVFHRDQPVDLRLTEYMIRMLDEGFDLVPMANFLENLLKNPSYRAKYGLYDFIEYGRMPITPDGCFLAYKAVNPDYTDIRTGTVDNSIGAEPSMPRNEVDEDPDQTCSKGYHVCSFDYLPRYSHNNGRVMVAKVNPADVVAVPRDYRNTKMRICRYEVVAEHEGYYQERENFLTDTVVRSEAQGSFFSEKVFAVELLYDGVVDSTEPFARLNEAAERYEELAEEAEDNPTGDGFEIGGDIYDEIRLVNQATGQVILSVSAE
ncbi:hypothetical protein [Thioalkalivibrio thiocyanodenitrificans]|uniref:hypothetical protein n=1 Tax=Thioalkalivibrio thiocyanodenitrificans TaxID=243063 RepID=UPI000373B9D5|nr:hypothetical protein [Thioalkalivibrio thiocyanodenitrificans]